MSKFVPVIITEPSDESSMNALAGSLDLVSRPDLYCEPVVVVPGYLLTAAILAAGHRAGRAAFVTVPDGSGHAIMAAAGCVIADGDCPGTPVLLMDAQADRDEFKDYHREVSRCARAAAHGAIVEFSDGDGRPTGDYAFSQATVRQEFMTHAPGIFAYAAGAAARAVSDRNVVRLEGSRLGFRDPGSFGEVVASVSKATQSMRHRIGDIKDAYSPWTQAKSVYEGFYGSACVPGA